MSVFLGEETSSSEGRRKADRGDGVGTQPPNARQRLLISAPSDREEAGPGASWAEIWLLHHSCFTIHLCNVNSHTKHKKNILEHSKNKDTILLRLYKVFRDFSMVFCDIFGHAWVQRKMHFLVR